MKYSAGFWSGISTYLRFALSLSLVEIATTMSCPPSHHLDISLAQAVQVSTDSHRSTCDVRESECVLRASGDPDAKVVDVFWGFRLSLQEMRLKSESWIYVYIVYEKRTLSKLEHGVFSYKHITAQAIIQKYGPMKISQKGMSNTIWHRESISHAWYALLVSPAIRPLPCRFSTPMPP